LTKSNGSEGGRPRRRSIEQIDVFQQFAKAARDDIAVDRFAAGQLMRKTANQNMASRKGNLPDASGGALKLC
jgi:hypothetical protein